MSAIANATVQIETIDPARADELLDSMTTNRRLSDDRVAAYARDMSEGRWAPLASMIVISQSGHLIDGQHRLAAVLQSNTTQKFVVRYEAPDSDIGVIDAGRSRSAADALRIEGYSYTTLLTVAARLCLKYPNSGTRKSPPSHSEVVQFVHDNPELVKFVHEHAPMHAHAPGWPSIGMLGALKFITPPSRRGDFDHLLRQVYWLDDPGQPAKNLVRWLQYRSKQNLKGGRTEQFIMWQALVRTLNAFYNGDEVAHLKVSKKSRERLQHERRMFKDRSW